MKALFYTIIFSIIGSANAQLKVDSMIPLRSYNHKPTVKLQKQRQLRSLSNVKQDEAKEIAAALCDQKVRSYKLTHRGQLLFYRIYTENCKVEINALDGSIISKIFLR